MTVTKERLASLGVVRISVSYGGKDLLCSLRNFSEGSLEFSVLSKIQCKSEDIVRIEIVFTAKDSGFERESADAVVKEAVDNRIALLLPDGLQEKSRRLFDRLALMEWQDREFGRRKEERFAVGKKNFHAFGLATPEQILFSKAAGIKQSCALLDVSFHGMKIITRMTGIVRKNPNFNVRLSFVNPCETAVVQAHTVHFTLHKTDSKTFAELSCQLLEPVHYLWKERVIGLMETLRKTT